MIDTIKKNVQQHVSLAKKAILITKQFFDYQLKTVTAIEVNFSVLRR